MATAQHNKLDLIVNGRPLSTDASTLAALVEHQGHGDARIATAVNGSFVAARARPTHELHTGDRIEIVSARQGG